MKYVESDVEALLSGCIFKFGPIGNLQRTLEKVTLGFSKLDELNDIYEYEFHLKHFSGPVSSVKTERIPEGPVTNIYDDSIKQATEYLSRYRVSCFSTSPSNPLMWAHYSENHGGVCYCFSASGSDKLATQPHTNCDQVKYSTLIPQLRIFEQKTTVGMLGAIMEEVVLTKSMDWSYENEYRYFGVDIPSVVGFNVGALKAVVFGRRLDNTSLKNAEQLIDDYNSKHSTTVRSLFAHRWASTYQLGICSQHELQGAMETSVGFNERTLDAIDSKPLFKKR